ncbi:MAG: response regulator [Phycisphaeraceae bacterium]
MKEATDSRRILLVDDHADTLMLQAMLLRRNGYEVMTAENAESALAQAAENDVDLVVSDLRLPDRNGVDLMRDLHERHGLHGVALTGAADDAEAAVQAEVGFVEVLIKPVTPAQVVQVIESALVSIDDQP